MQQTSVTSRSRMRGMRGATLILLLAFEAMASGSGTDTNVMATGLGIGILLDATIVRSLLVPSLASASGQWSWWLPEGLATLLRLQPAVIAQPEPVKVGQPWRLS